MSFFTRMCNNQLDNRHELVGGIVMGSPLI